MDRVGDAGSPETSLGSRVSRRVVRWGSQAKQAASTIDSDGLGRTGYALQHVLYNNFQRNASVRPKWSTSPSRLSADQSYFRACPLQRT